MLSKITTRNDQVLPLLDLFWRTRWITTANFSYSICNWTLSLHIYPEYASKAILRQALNIYVKYSFISIQIWNHYDSDKSGYLEGEEIEAFLKDMLEQQGSSPSPQRISDYKDFIVRRFRLSTSNISFCMAIFTFIWEDARVRTAPVD